MRLFIDSSIAITIAIDKTKIIYANSYYVIEGPEKWVTIINSAISNIIVNMSDIPFYEKLIAKHEFSFISLLVLLINFALILLFKNIYIKLDEVIRLGTNVILALVSYQLFYIYINNVIHTIEFKLNEEYIDPAKKIA